LLIERKLRAIVLDADRGAADVLGLANGEAA
jgi:hypothetical protein